MTKRTRLQKFISYVLIICMTVSLVNFTWLPSYADDTGMTNEEILREYVVSTALAPTNHALVKDGVQVAEILIQDKESKEIEVCLNEPDFPAMQLLFMDFLNLLFQYKDIHTVKVNNKSYTLNRLENPGGTTESDQFNLMLITAYAVLGDGMTDEEFFNYLYGQVNDLTIGAMDGGKVDVVLYAMNDVGQEYTVDYTMEFYNKAHDVIVHYVDQDGQQLAEDYKETLNKGEAFEVTSPVIQDYQADQTVISGIMEKKDQEYTVTYTIDPDLVTGYYHYYLNGEPWQNQTIAAGRNVKILQPNTIEGHKFSGWTWKDAEGNEIPAPTTATAGTFYAYGSQTANVHTLTYKADGQIISAEQVPYGTPLTLMQPEPRDGYTFSGWATDDGTKIPSAMPDKDVTLVGSYKPIEYTVIFRDYNDHIITQKTDYQYGQALEVPSNLSRPDTLKYTYKFLGWSTDGTAATLIENLPETVTANAEYKAVYEENFVNYTVVFKDHDGRILSQKTDYHYEDTVTEPQAPADWSDESYDYTFKGWDKSVSKVYGNAAYTAVYDKKAKGYTVSFYDWNDRLISEKVYKYGDTITVPADPVRTEDNTYTYKFTGWTPSVNGTATADASYKATYAGTFKNYSIVFKAEDGSVISQKDDYHYGDTINPPADPIKAADETYTYTFAGWGKEVSTVKGNAVYQAVFTPVCIDYTIDFIVDGSTISSKDYHYGDTVEVPEAVKPSDSIFDYVFKGWDSEVSKVTGDKTYTAAFEAVAKEYTITFVNWDDSLISSLKYGWHATAIEPQTPVKQADNIFNYVFKGWDPVFDALVTGDAWYKAVFDAVYKAYTVQFVDDEGNVIDSKTYHYGDTVVVPEDPQKAQTGAYSYTFTGWDKDVTEVKGNTIYTAVFKQTQREYTVKFLNEDGTTISEEVYHYGDAVKMPAEPSSYEKDGRTYTFHHWDPVVSEQVTGDAAYTAVFVDEANSVTVNFYNHDGTVLLYEEAVNVGDDVSVDGKTATRAQTDYYNYTFAGWVTAVNGTEAPDFANVQEDFNVYASFTKEKRTYTVTFLDEDGSLLSEDTYYYNNTITTPEDPTKAADVKNTYVFAGWDQEPGVVTGNLTFKAVYKAVPIDYTVTFTVDGKETKKSYHYGDSILFDGNVDKADTAEFDYTFSGWKKDSNEELLTTLGGEKVTGNAAYEAVYEVKTQQYTVTFYDESGNRMLGTKTVNYGTAAEFPGETPEKATDPVNTYAFAGWMTEAGGSSLANLTEVKENLKVYAGFTATARTYTAVIYDADGSVLAEDTYAYGDDLNAVDNPTKDADHQYSYTFRYWERSDGRTLDSLAGEMVTADVSYTPVFDQTPVPYEVTWIVEGTERKETYAYNDALQIPQAPSKDKTDKYTYVFAGWVKDGSDKVLTDLSTERVTTAVTYTAKFDEIINTHKVSFYCDDVLVETVTVNYGDAAAAPQPLAKESDVQYHYQFTGWNQDFSEITGDLRVDAVYESILRTYTIRWNIDGKVTETEAAYGQVPAFEGTPAKAETPKFKYVFTGWDTEPVAVTGPATYTAQFEQQYNYVATINGTYYKTIESALAAAKTGDAVIVEHNCTITEDTVVPKGVTLFLPCQDNDKVFVPSIDTYNPEGTNVNGKPVLYKQLTIAEGVKVDIKGTVIVNAITGRPRSSGDHDISGGYSEIILNGQINVQDGGLLDVYGYVRGDGQVTTEAGGTIYDLYVVRNWRGGSQALSMYQESVYPMNEADCHNISVPMNIVYGATYSGTVRMYADDGSGPRYYCTRFPQVDVDNGLFRLTSKDGYVQRTFDGTYETYDIYGGAKFSESTLYIVAMNLSTSLFIYPIDGDIRFKLNDGNYSFEESYKFLPGSSVEVDGDSTLTIGEDVVVTMYEVFNDPPNTGNTQYPSNRPAAVLNMDSGSELRILGKLGGRVSCGDVKITRGDDGGLSVTTKEANGYRNGSIKITNDFKATRSGFDGTWYNQTYYWNCSSSAGHALGNWKNITTKIGYQKGECANCDYTEERYAPAEYLTEAIAALPEMAMTEEKLTRIEALRDFYGGQNTEIQSGVSNIGLLEEQETEAETVAVLRNGYQEPSVENLGAAFAAYADMETTAQEKNQALYEELVTARDAFVAKTEVESAAVTSEGLDSIQISWTACSDAEKYQVTLLNEAGDVLDTVEKTATSHEFTGLQQTGIYEVQVRPIIVINGEPFLGKASAASGKTAISEVQNLQIAQITMDSVTAEWEAPAFVSNKQTGYQLVLKDAKGDVVQQAETTELTYTFSSLQTGKVYAVSVYPIFQLDNQLHLGLVQSIETMTVPGAVEDVVLTALTEDTAAFAWNGPTAAKVEGFAAEGYEVTLQSADQKVIKTVNAETESCTFTGLAANQNYIVVVKPAYTYYGKTCDTAETTFAFSTLPQAVSGLRMTSYQNDALAMAWDVSKVTAGSTLALKGYDVTLKTADGMVLETIRTEKTAQVFEGLSENTAYQIEIRGVYKFGQQLYLGAAAAQNSKTLPGPVQGLDVVQHGAEALSFQWKAYSDMPLVKYKVTLKGADGTVIKTLETKEPKAMFSGLEHGSVYTLTVDPVYTIGNEEWTGAAASVAGTTLPGMVKKLTVDEITQNTVKAFWKAPEQYHSDAVLQHYIVKLTDDEGKELQSAKVQGESHSFAGLSAKTAYQIVVTPVYLEGGKDCNGFSKVVSVTTMAATVTPGTSTDTQKPEDVTPPADSQKPEDVMPPADSQQPGDSGQTEVQPPTDTPAEQVKAPGKVTNLKVSVRKAASVTLKWKAPKSGADGYKVQRLSANGKVQKIVYTAKVTYKFTKLKAATVYQYKVTPYVKSANGKAYGKAVSLKAVTKPAKVTVKSLKVGKKQLKVTWKKTAGTKYQVQIATNKKFTKGVKKYTISSKYVTKTVKKLKKGTRYYVRVRAVKTYSGKTYYGAWSKVQRKTVK